MKDIENQVVEWHRKTFPHVTIQEIKDKLDEERWELFDATTCEDIFEEVADVCIVAMAFLSRRGKTLSGEIEKKLKINQKRVWGENGERIRHE